MARYDDLTASQIAGVLRVKLGPEYYLRNPAIDTIPTPKGPEKVFKVMIITGLDPNRHFAYFVSRISGKDMDDWLQHALIKIRGYSSHNPLPATTLH
jgi:hypothetical protein